jgi:hypothetical protein
LLLTASSGAKYDEKSGLTAGVMRIVDAPVRLQDKVLD